MYRFLNRPQRVIAALIALRSPAARPIVAPLLREANTCNAQATLEHAIKIAFRDPAADWHDDDIEQLLGLLPPGHSFDNPPYPS